MVFSPRAAFKIFSSSLILSDVVMMFSGVVFFVSSAWSSLNFLGLWMYSSHQMWKCFVAIIFSMFSVSLPTPTPPYALVSSETLIMLILDLQS